MGKRRKNRIVSLGIKTYRHIKTQTLQTLGYINQASESTPHVFKSVTSLYRLSRPSCKVGGKLQYELSEAFLVLQVKVFHTHSANQVSYCIPRKHIFRKSQNYYGQSNKQTDTEKVIILYFIHCKVFAYSQRSELKRGGYSTIRRFSKYLLEMQS